MRRAFRTAGRLAGIPASMVHPGSLLNYLKLFTAYKQRVEADSGVVVSDALTKQVFRTLEPTIDSIKFAWAGVAGSKLRTDGIYKYYEKIYDMGDVPNDGSQTTELNQPYTSGDIAPTENVGMLNPNGDSRYVTHPEISFAADEAWSVTTRLNWNGSESPYITLWGNITNFTALSLKESTNIFYFQNESIGGIAGGSTLPLIGKFNTVTCVANGSSNLKIYINGESISNLTIETNITIRRFIMGFSGRYTEGSISAHIIRSQALTADQVKAEADFLAEVYPPIPTVEIGLYDVATSSSQAVASSDGATITEAADNADWATGAARWRYYNDDSQIGSWAAKLYNKAGKLVLVANPPSGYHYATEAELTAIAASGGNAIKKEGTDYFNTTGGTNSTGFTAVGTGKCNTDGTFQDLKNTSTFWCADSDKVLKLNHADNTATIVVAAANEGHALRLVKD